MTNRGMKENSPSFAKRLATSFGYPAPDLSRSVRLASPTLGLNADAGYAGGSTAAMRTERLKSGATDVIELAAPRFSPHHSF